MNHPVDVHPEDLLDREREQGLMPEEQRRLDAHAARCPACALVRKLENDFVDERRGAIGDPSFADRLIDAALGHAPAVAPPSLRRSYAGVVPRRRRAWAIGAMVMFAASASTASLWSVRHTIVHGLLANLTYQTKLVEKDPAPVRSRSESTPVKPLEAKVAVPEITLPSSELVSAAVPRAKAAEETTPSAELLFTSANEARRRGDSARAIKLYRQLQQQFPGTRQETMSRVSLARLLLDRVGDAPAALALFTRYLDVAPNGTLAEEARLGKALALMRMGRPSEERQAWQQLLTAHPSSIHTERARRRLDELR